MDQNIKYAVVETIEDGNPYCSAVPETWLENGVLRWPIKSADVVRGRKMGVIPKDDWKKMTCRIIKKGIENFQAALEFEADAEYISSSSEDIQAAPMLLANQNCSNLLNLNSIMEDIIEHADKEEITSYQNATNSTPVQLTNMPIILSELEHNLIGNENGTYYVQENAKTVQCTNCLDNNQRLISIEKALADIKVTLDVLLERNSSQSKDDSVVDDYDWKNFPLSTVDQLEECEKQLRSDKTFKINLKKKLSVFGGADDSSTAKVLSKWLFMDSLLEKFSWAGTSEKHAFQSFTEIVDIILFTVRKNYPSYTAHANANFFKNYLKHAKFRQQNKSKSKAAAHEATPTPP